MPATYDPNVIQEFADRLYTKAKSIIRSYTILGVILLGFGGLTTQQPVLGLVGAVIGGAIGYIMGKEKAFSYKLQAQTALCQVQIEINSKQSA
jgi:hypothetical protein